MQSDHHNTSNVEKEIINVEETTRKSPHHIIVGSSNNNDSGPLHREQEEVQSQQRNNLEAGPILVPVSPKSLLIAQDNQLENALNDENDDWSTDSQDSVVKDSQEAVEILTPLEATGIEGRNDKAIAVVNTQVNTPTPTMPLAGETSRQDAALHTPDRVAKDLVFLKESWANMVEAEGFQIHMSKNKNKKSLKENEVV
jgi:hypothetical protein